ncbi:TPA: hypothetical protein QEM49_003979 [Pseudomonas putida]|uniref:hypothetical protein n=1 Tax=Pseudomonas putida TaxID=303 RepID=UPI0023645894|nr:hypothetical protein [Pseudomonas putida]MDD2009599.1 hypothetical protein [Pseudomonas putida]HDS1779431.1 hypothetical protein [Pseudomonas putida]
MQFIKKLSFLIILLIVCGYASLQWQAHQNFERTTETIVRQLGSSIIADLASTGDVCRATAQIDSISVSAPWFSSSGSASLYLSGRNGAALAIAYKAEAAGEKIYVTPVDAPSAQAAVMQFAIKRCS